MRDADKWQKAVNKTLHGVSPPQVTALGTLQPFHAPTPSDTLLATLDDLWNADKHRMLTPRLAVILDPGNDAAIFMVDPPAVIVQTQVRHGHPFVHGNELLRCRREPVDSELRMVPDAGIPVDIAFGDNRLPSTDAGRLVAAARVVVRHFEQFDDAADTTR